MWGRSQTAASQPTSLKDVADAQDPQQAPQPPLDYGIPADPSPDNWGPLGVPLDDESGDFDRVNDWDFDILDVHHPGYDTPEEAAADADDRARFFA